MALQLEVAERDAHAQHLVHHTVTLEHALKRVIVHIFSDLYHTHTHTHITNTQELTDLSLWHAHMRFVSRSRSSAPVI